MMMIKQGARYSGGGSTLLCKPCSDKLASGRMPASAAASSRGCSLGSAKLSLWQQNSGPSQPAPCKQAPRTRTHLGVMAPDRRGVSAETEVVLLEQHQDVLQQREQQLRLEQRQQQLERSSASPWIPPAAPASSKPAKPAAAPVAPADPTQYWNHPSYGWRRQLHHPTKTQLWESIRNEAWNDARTEPALASYMYSAVLSHPSLEKSLAFVLSNKLQTSVLGSVQLLELFQEAYDSNPDIVDAAIADLLTVRDRDPACSKYSQALLFFKGYQAIQCFRVQHWLWQHGRRTLALALSARVSEIFHVDIHPGARIGKGALIDHGTGVVIGETAVLGDNVSLLHRVSLGGTGTGQHVRHPTLGHGVLLGAGVSVLGPVVIGAGSKVGAGSVVVSDLPAHSVSVGVPATVIKRDLQLSALGDMDQGYEYFDFII